MDIKFCYQYRDGANYKQYNEVSFSNPNKRSLEEVDNIIKNFLIDSCWFYAEAWHLPDMHFTEYVWENEIDHSWHEYKGLVYADTDKKPEKNIEDFLLNVMNLK